MTEPRATGKTIGLVLLTAVSAVAALSGIVFDFTATPCFSIAIRIDSPDTGRSPFW